MIEIISVIDDYEEDFIMENLILTDIAVYAMGAVIFLSILITFSLLISWMLKKLFMNSSSYSRNDRYRLRIPTPADYDVTDA